MPPLPYRSPPSPGAQTYETTPKPYIIHTIFQRLGVASDRGSTVKARSAETGVFDEKNTSINPHPKPGHPLCTHNHTQSTSNRTQTISNRKQLTPAPTQTEAADAPACHPHNAGRSTLFTFQRAQQKPPAPKDSRPSRSQIRHPNLTRTRCELKAKNPKAGRATNGRNEREERQPSVALLPALPQHQNAGLAPSPSPRDGTGYAEQVEFAAFQRWQLAGIVLVDFTFSGLVSRVTLGKVALGICPDRCGL
jgi:hypothetical protein